MKKIAIILLSIFLVSCGEAKQDITKLEEFEKQYAKHSKNIANYVYIMSLESKNDNSQVEKNNEIIEKSKNLKENCNIIIEKNLQTECNNTLTEQVEILEKIFSEEFSKNKEAYEKHTETRQNFGKNLKNYLDSEKLK